MLSSHPLSPAGLTAWSSVKLFQTLGALELSLSLRAFFLLQSVLLSTVLNMHEKVATFGELG
jgi:hypothetical protein